MGERFVCSLLVRLRLLSNLVLCLVEIGRVGLDHGRLASLEDAALQLGSCQRLRSIVQVASISGDRVVAIAFNYKTQRETALRTIELTHNLFLLNQSAKSEYCSTNTADLNTE